MDQSLLPVANERIPCWSHALEPVLDAAAENICPGQNCWWWNKRTVAAPLLAALGTVGAVALLQGSP